MVQWEARKHILGAAVRATTEAASPVTSKCDTQCRLEFKASVLKMKNFKTVI